MEYPIDISCLSKRFPRTTPFNSKNLLSFNIAQKFTVACDDINLKLNKGELLSLIGPNGSGKTTLIRILSTIILPDRGSIFVNGFDVVKDSLKAKSCIGLVTSENKNFYARLTGRENLRFYGSLYGLLRGETEKRIEELSSLLSIEESLDKLFQENSSGIRQRFALARGLLADPPILLLDEPTKNLDPSLARDVRLFIKNDLVKKKEKTILLASHLLSEVSEISDRIVIMNKGSIQTCGTLSELRFKMGKTNAELDDVYKFYVGC